MTARSLATAMVVLTTCVALVGCRPHEAPVEQDRAALSVALGLPAARLRYAGGGNDPYWHYVRYWEVLAAGQNVAALGALAKTTGLIESSYGQVCGYYPDAGGDLKLHLRARGTLPLTEAAARSAALDVCRRLWPSAASDQTTIGITSHQTSLGEKSGTIRAWDVELTFPKSPRDSARSAGFTFIVADGTFEEIWARLWD
jgi:hypothetical protein